MAGSGTFTSSSDLKKRSNQWIKRARRSSHLSRLRSATKKNIDPAGTPQLGLVAEEVEKVNPDLVVRDKEGKPYSVRYEQVNAMLLNEFLKEHQTVQELKASGAKQEANTAKEEATIARQQKQIEALTTGLQKVSAQVETSRPVSQTVANNQ